MCVSRVRVSFEIAPHFAFLLRLRHSLRLIDGAKSEAVGYGEAGGFAEMVVEANAAMEQWWFLCRVGWETVGRVGWETVGRVGWETVDRVGWETVLGRVGWETVGRVGWQPVGCGG